MEISPIAQVALLHTEMNSGFRLVPKIGMKSARKNNILKSHHTIQPFCPITLKSQGEKKRSFFKKNHVSLFKCLESVTHELTRAIFLLYIRLTWVLEPKQINANLFKLWF